jgi:nucleoside-diphosphate-sugar epimerase
MSWTRPRHSETAPLRALVTGAAGFLGSHLCERLLAEGFEVIGVDNFLTGRPENLRTFEQRSAFTFIEHDIIEPLGLGGPLAWIFHLASPASPPKYRRYSLETLRCNAEGTFHLLELASRHRAAFLLASTSEVYGDPERHPQSESYWGSVNPNGPRSVYDEAKRYAEALTMDFRRREGLDTRIIRIFNTYGPRMAADDGRVVSNFVTQALTGGPLTVYGDGSQTRSLQYVDDLVEGVIALASSSLAGPVNLGNPEELTMLELAETTRQLVGERVEIRFQPLPQDDPQRRRPDITLARRRLGWQPRVGLSEGLRRTIDYFRLELGERRIAPAERPAAA